MAVGAVEMLEERRMLSCGAGGMETIPVPDAAAYDNAGMAMDVEGDLILVGVPGRNAAYLISASSGDEIAEFRNPDALAGGFGQAVAIVGNHIAIGAPFAEGGQGAVYVYGKSNLNSDPELEWNGLAPSNILNGFQYSSNASGSGFGSALSGYSDGTVDHIVAAAWQGTTDGNGRVYVINADVKNSGTEPGIYEQVFENPNEQVRWDMFGSGLAVRQIGTTTNILIGSRQGGVAMTGEAFLFDLDGNIVQKYEDPHAATGDFFGEEVGFWGDNVVIGAPGDGDNVDPGGKVYIMNPEGDVVGTFDDPTPTYGEAFGYSFAIDGNQIHIGAPGATTAVSVKYYDEYTDGLASGTMDVPVGAVYTYDLSSLGLLNTTSDPTAPDAFNYDLVGFGASVGFANGKLVVADPYDDTAAIDAGAVYVFGGGSTGQITVSLTGPSQAVRQQPLTFIGSYVTPCGAALDATWTITNAANQVVASGTGLKVNFVPQDAGSYTVTMSFIYPSSVSATDTASVPDVVATEHATVPVSATATIGGSFYVGGTSGADAVIITPTADGVQMYMNGTIATYAFPGDIVIFGGSGLNTVVLSNSVTRPLFYFGGPDTDLVRGGNGGNVIVGNGGADLLVGGSGRDLLIGGRGVDMMVGNANDDILISGTTNYDNDLTSLQAIFAEWSRTDKSYADRVNTLRTESDTLPALNDDTVFDDGQLDILTGNAGTDWFLFNKDGPGVRDWVTDLGASEFANDIDFINQP